MRQAASVLLSVLILTVAPYLASADRIPTNHNDQTRFANTAATYFDDGVPPPDPPGYNCTNTTNLAALDGASKASAYFRRPGGGNNTIQTSVLFRRDQPAVLPASPISGVNYCTKVYPNSEVAPDGAVVYLCATLPQYFINTTHIEANTDPHLAQLLINSLANTFSSATVTVPAIDIANGIDRMRNTSECNHASPGGPPVVGGSIGIGWGSALLNSQSADIYAKPGGKAPESPMWIDVGFA